MMMMMMIIISLYEYDSLVSVFVGWFRFSRSFIGNCMEIKRYKRVRNAFILTTQCETPFSSVDETNR